jgi:topoisomerase-4 subunit A
MEPTNPSESVKSNSESVESVQSKSVESPKSEESVPPKPIKKVDFEITNPDDIEIDDKGQLGLF